MKNPAKLLRIGLVLGMICTLAEPSIAQEPGSAVKGGSITLTDAIQSTTTAAPKSYRPAHKRLQKEPRNLPVSKTSRPAGRAILAEPQSITEVEPQTLP